jgi:hypothetical protein
VVEEDVAYVEQFWISGRHFVLSVVMIVPVVHVSHVSADGESFSQFSIDGVVLSKCYAIPMHVDASPESLKPSLHSLHFVAPSAVPLKIEHWRISVFS